ncbi:recombinase family protein [Endozoicomonas atrinae]|uniref:recombinase family protein n=1 Tax=Endozoicomonas atrinae TaxID=1333660 RepID=UPI003AFFB937
MNTDVPIYCYSYHRISTNRQLSGGGIKRQIEASQAICREKDWIMDTSFQLTDIGKSAYHGKNLDDRATLGGFLNAVDDGLIKRPAVLLVESLDRLSRANIMDALELFIRILNAGITIYTHIDGMTYNKNEIQKNFSPLLISITLMCRSHEESETKSKRIKQSWKQMEDTLRNGGLGRSTIYPHWIDISSGKPKIIKNKARVIQDIFKLCARDNLSYVDICNTINDKYGDVYNAIPSKVQRVLRSVKVLGLYEASNKEHINAFPAIVDEDTFYLAHAMIAKRKKMLVGRPEKRAVNFFKTLMFCGDCGRSICNVGRGQTSAFLCYSHYIKQKCGQKSSLGVNRFQTSLLYALSLIDKDDMLEKTANKEKSKLSKTIISQQSLIDDKKQRIHNLVDLIAAGSKTGIEVATRIENEIEVAEKELEKLKNRLDMLNSPSMASSIDHVKSFHRRFLLEKAEKKDQQPFIESLSHLVEKVVVHSPEDGYRTKVTIHLLSGIEITVLVRKDYESEVFKGSKRIGKYVPDFQTRRRKRAVCS